MKGLGKYLRWLWRGCAGIRGRLALNVILGTLNVAVSLLFIGLCKHLVDIATGNAEGSIPMFAGIVIGVILVRLAVTAANVRLENLTSSKMNFIIRRRIYSNLLQSKWTGRERFHSGDTLNRLETDVSTVTNVICSDFPQLITTLIQLVAAVAYLSTMDVRLALVLLVITPVFLIASRLFFRKMRTLTRNIRDTESLVQSHLQESLQHRVVISSMENGGQMEDRLDDLQDTEYDQVKARTRFTVFARTVVSATFSFGYIAAFLWGVFGISSGAITFGVMTAFLQLVGQIQRPVVNITRQIPSFIYSTASIDRLIELEDSPKEEAGDPIRIEGPIGIRVEDLTFRYPDGEYDVFNGFSCDFAPLSRTAIVGETGIGKSTLIRLILALLEPSSGGITIYGNSGSAPASPRTRCNLVYVPQGNTLFSGSIRENLLMGDPEADEERLKEVLEVAQAGFVFSLPEGMDSSCGEGGAGLSEGQAQRIAIARGLLRPGSILLLDEFSSSLDPETEEKLMESVSRFAEGKTIIFITHREKVSARCDNILRL
ncbi:MAG: ABC transporter ATP-binding protein [Bacteroidales bacterium]|nr:ABC transporter ATP-binding protein [Bacteroidales bacterium]